MNTLERISRHSRGYKAERRAAAGLASACVPEYPRRPQVNRHPSRRFNAAYTGVSPGIDSAANPIFRPDDARADFPAEAAVLKIIRACRITLA